MSAESSIDFLTRGARLNLDDSLRHAQLLHFPAQGDLLISGDLHNHRRNFARLQTYADLPRFPHRHVILQEIIHGGEPGAAGEDTSLDLLLDAIRWALQYPGQVHFLLANHDLAQINTQSILKEGGNLTEQFQRAFKVRYGAAADKVAAAFEQFVRSMPLAAITVTGVFVSHSLPSPHDLADFDPAILRRPLTDADRQRGGLVYKMLWGRGQTDALLAALSRHWFAELYICGHQPQERGYGILGQNMLILDSSHNHGVILPLRLEHQYTMEQLLRNLIPLAAVE